MFDSKFMVRYCPKCLKTYTCDNIFNFEVCTDCKSGLFKHQKLIEIKSCRTEGEYFDEIIEIKNRYNSANPEHDLYSVEAEFIWLYENCLKDSPDYDNANFEADLAHFEEIGLKREMNKINKQITAIHCPNCNSTNTEKISTTKKVASTAVLGLASSTIGKNYKCKNCGYIW